MYWKTGTILLSEIPDRSKVSLLGPEILDSNSASKALIVISRSSSSPCWMKYSWLIAGATGCAFDTTGTNNPAIQMTMAIRWFVKYRLVKKSIP